MPSVLDLPIERQQAIAKYFNKTHEVWLSDDTLIKMMIHHPELDLLPVFAQVQEILDNPKLTYSRGRISH